MRQVQTAYNQRGGLFLCERFRLSELFILHTSARDDTGKRAIGIHSEAPVVSFSLYISPRCVALYYSTAVYSLVPCATKGATAKGEPLLQHRMQAAAPQDTSALHRLTYIPM